MSAFSDYMEAAICNYIRGTAMPTAPTGVYVSLHNGSPTDTGTGGTDVTTQVRTAGRVQATFGAPNDGAMSNSAVVDFGPSQNATTVTHFGVWTASSAGNLIMYGSLTSGGGSVALGANVSFATGALTLAVA